jgi:hypothetical protein
VYRPAVTQPAYKPVVVTFLISSIIFFLIFFGCWYYEERNEYKLSFADESITSSEQGIVMSAEGANIQVYQINKETGYISSSSFMNEKKEKIEASGIKFNGEHKFDIHNISPGPDNPYFISLSISPFTRGVFQGWIVFTDIQDTSIMYIPAVISTKSYVLAPIFLILSGVCFSVCIWELWRYYRSGPGTTDRELNRLQNLYANIDHLAAPIYIKGDRSNNIEGDKSMENDLLRAMRNNILRRAAAYSLRSEQPITKKIAFMEIIPSLLGITFGLFTTFSDYVPNLLIFDYYQVGILFGIGLGAGSLKELVDKDSDSGCICVELPELPK